MSEIHVDFRDRVNCLFTASRGEPSHLHQQTTMMMMFSILHDNLICRDKFPNIFQIVLTRACQCYVAPRKFDSLLAQWLFA